MERLTDSSEISNLSSSRLFVDPSSIGSLTMSERRSDMNEEEGSSSCSSLSLDVRSSSISRLLERRDGRENYCCSCSRKLGCVEAYSLVA